MQAGDAGKGTRRMVPITGGTFEGPAIKGTVVPGGYDWQLLRSDAVLEIDARYVLKTDDGTFITITNSGLRHGPAETMQRLANGEEVNAKEYYFRSVPMFETGNPKYDWLIKNIFVATGIRQKTKVLITVWRLL